MDEESAAAADSSFRGVEAGTAGSFFDGLSRVR